jgi:RNA polymerase subunit RPABC4/transcription elongation factor Spt4
MNHDSKFKYVFFALAAMVLFLFFALFQKRLRMAPPAGSSVPLFDRPIAMAIPVLFLFVIAAVVAAYVYRDAKERGLDPWLWATVAAFVPYFIGLIIYLVLRQSARRRCSKCGRFLQNDFSNCPYCGEPVSLTCPQCGQAVAHDWKVCPRCAVPLNGSGK